MKKVLISSLIFIITLYGLFLAFERFSSRPAQKRTFTKTISRGDESALPDWRMISQFPPSSVFQYSGFEDEKEVFNVHYEFNKYALRKESSSGKKENHFILGGCSLVFGIALSDDETLSSILRSKLPLTNVVNFGFPGGGLQTLMKAIELINLRAFVPESKGYFLYGFEHDHFSRWRASAQYLDWINPEHVYYEYTGNSFKETQLKRLSAWRNLQMARKAGLVHSYLKANPYRHLNENEFKSYIEGIKYVRKLYLAKFPGGKFKVLIYPFTPADPSVNLFKELLVKNGLAFYDSTSDYEEFLKNRKLDKSDMIVPVDGHPNKLFNEFLAGMIVKKVIQ